MLNEKGQLNSCRAVIANGLDVLYPHHLEIDHDHQSSNGEAFLHVVLHEKYSAMNDTPLKL